MPSAPLSESLLSSGADVGGLVLCGRSALSLSKVERVGDSRFFAAAKVAALSTSAGSITLMDASDLPIIQGRSIGVDRHGYAYISKGGKSVLVHRLITQAAPGLEVDHINGDRLDNRRENLRVCTRGENARNRKLNRNSTTGFKGVSFDKRRGMFRAAIKCGGKFFHLGHFADPAEAHAAYLAKANELHGEFVRNSGDVRSQELRGVCHASHSFARV